METTLILLGLLAIGLGQAAVLTSLTACNTDSECGTGECCAIPSQHPIMSKRQLGVVSKGMCMKYNLENQGCNVFDKANGYCGCEPGLTCVFERTDIRRSPPMWPGRTLCKKQ